jgi:hypothetical protein
MSCGRATLAVIIPTNPVHATTEYLQIFADAASAAGSTRCHSPQLSLRRLIGPQADRRGQDVYRRDAVNGCENFFSLYEEGVDAQEFRTVLSSVSRKRLTYDQTAK